jgi:pyruvate-formate lyase-activating enzyme
MEAPTADAIAPVHPPRSTGLVADVIESSFVDGPGHRYVVFLQGCNFDCLACHNPQTIAMRNFVDGHHPVHRTTNEIVDRIARVSGFLDGVTVSGGEATCQPRFVHALFSELGTDPRTSRLTRLLDSNGSTDLAFWDHLAPVFEGAMIDLKCLDDGLHRYLTGRPNANVLATIEHLRRIDRLGEVRLLIVGGVNDDDDLVRRTAAWLSSVDPTMRVRVTGFRRHGARPGGVADFREPGRGDLERVVAILTEHGDFGIDLVV